MVEILLQNELINVRAVTDNYNEEIKLFFLYKQLEQEL